MLAAPPAAASSSAGSVGPKSVTTGVPLQATMYARPGVIRPHHRRAHTISLSAPIVIELWQPNHTISAAPPRRTASAITASTTSCSDGPPFTSTRMSRVPHQIRGHHSEPFRGHRFAGLFALGSAPRTAHHRARPHALHLRRRTPCSGVAPSSIRGVFFIAPAPILASRTTTRGAAQVILHRRHARESAHAQTRQRPCSRSQLLRQQQSAAIAVMQPIRPRMNASRVMSGGERELVSSTAASYRRGRISPPPASAPSRPRPIHMHLIQQIGSSKQFIQPRPHQPADERSRQIRPEQPQPRGRGHDDIAEPRGQDDEDAEGLAASSSMLSASPRSREIVASCNDRSSSPSPPPATPRPTRSSPTTIVRSNAIPAASAASMSRSASPIIQLAPKSRPNSLAAASSIPGDGLRDGCSTFKQRRSPSGGTGSNTPHRSPHPPPPVPPRTSSRWSPPPARSCIPHAPPPPDSSR